MIKNVFKKKNTQNSSLRQLIQVNLKLYLSGKKTFKKLVKGLYKKGGRNNKGRLTCYTQGGGHKKNYRILSTLQNRKFLPFSIVKSIDYDPFRSAFLCCCYFKESGEFKYIIAPQNIKQGTILAANYGLRRSYPGSPCLLYYSQIGDLLYNVNLNNGPLSFNIAKAAGTFCKIIKKEIKSFYAIIKIPSGLLMTVSLASLGFLGKVSNPFVRFENKGKAGRNRWLGKRPCVRGVAMNPVDHPHGGGEGKSSGGRPSCTPWSFPTKGQPTKRFKVNKYLLKYS
jgi:large subunit ribosomal protein L2